MGEDRARGSRRPTPVDAVVIAGAIAVAGILTTAFFVVDATPSSSTTGFVLAPIEPEAQPPVAGLPQLAPGPVADPAPSRDPTPALRFTTVAGTARVEAWDDALDSGLPPACGHDWAPQVQLENPVGPGLVPATVQVPGVLSGLVIHDDEATWTCSYSYRADVPAGPGS